MQHSIRAPGGTGSRPAHACRNDTCVCVHPSYLGSGLGGRLGSSLLGKLVLIAVVLIAVVIIIAVGVLGSSGSGLLGGRRGDLEVGRAAAGS